MRYSVQPPWILSISVGNYESQFRRFTLLLSTRPLRVEVKYIISPYCCVLLQHWRKVHTYQWIYWDQTMDYNLALSTRMPCSAVCANEPASLYDGFILLRHQIHRYGLGSHVTSDLWRLVLEAGQLGRAKLFNKNCIKFFRVSRILFAPAGSVLALQVLRKVQDVITHTLIFAKAVPSLQFLTAKRQCLNWR